MPTTINLLIQAPGTSAHSDKSQPERQFKHDLSPFVGDAPFAPRGDFDQPEMLQMKSSRRPERAVANHQGAGPGMCCIIGAKAAHGMAATISQVEAYASPTQLLRLAQFCSDR